MKALRLFTVISAALVLVAGPCRELFAGPPPFCYQEIDGSPSGCYKKLKVSNGALTDNGDGSMTLVTGVGGGGDFSSNTSTSVDGEIVLFSGTGGKTGKRATTTGILKGTSGVISAASAGTDYLTPTGDGSGLSGVVTSEVDPTVDTSAKIQAIIGAGVYQASDADLSSWAGVTRASGFDTFTATPSSANLASLLTDEVGDSGGFTRGTAGSTNDCAKWDASGNLVSAGAACGSGGSGAFSDAGDPIVQNTTTKDVVIGTSQVNSSKLTVDGDADQVQFTIQGNSSQTNDLMVAEQSDGTEVFSIDKDGNVTGKSFTSTGTGQSTVDDLSVTSSLFLGGTDSTADVYYDSTVPKTVFNSALGVKSTGAATTNYCNDANTKGCWAMEGSTTETDLSSSAEDLTVSTSDTIPQSTDKKFGTYSRDWESADTEYLTHADGGSTEINGANQAISICGWFKRESDAGVNEIIVSKNSSASNFQYALYVDNSATDKISFLLSSDGSTTNIATGATATTTGTWYHACAVYNDTDQRIYLNGSLDSNGASNPKTYSAGIFNGTAPFAIGAHFPAGSASNYFDGLIDDVIVLNRALSSTEVSEIYNYGIQGLSAGIKTFATSDTTPDVSGSSRWNTGVSAVTITDFDGSGIFDGQLLYVVSKGDVTFDCTSSGLKCGTTDLVTASGDLTEWMYDGTDWIIIHFTDQSDNLS